MAAILQKNETWS